MDQIDRKILSILRNNAEMSKADIARLVGLAASAVSERIKRLESSGAIQAYEARIDADLLGKPLLAFVFVSDVKPAAAGALLGDDLADVSGLEELHKIAGEDCYLLKIRVAGTDELNRIIETEINPLPMVSRVRTTIVLKKLTERPPLAGHDLTRP